MRHIITFALAAVFSTAAAAQVYVHGYTTKNGTYVAPHYQSAPDGNTYNNWSTRGNVNPYTGQPGTKNPYTWSNPQGGYGNRSGVYRRPTTTYGYPSSNTNEDDAQ